jgi:AraC family transcriptional regulator, regulatory protein of adaptative response / methylated-DNA-[protein]-cysteine methyltransferase
MQLKISESASQPMPAAAPAKPVADIIYYAAGECTLGQVLVARSVAGVCAILIGAGQNKLEADLAARFPGAKLAMREAVHDDLAKVVRFMDNPAEGLDLPLDLRGTPFQHRVWETLRTIPAGTTVTYTGLAHRIGAPASVRAVARACASNPVALAVPCHRAVRSDGDLAGYRWGLERKRELIKKEAMA